MTKQEAIQEMKKEKKLTHTTFSDEEWITMAGLDTIVAEDGYTMAEEDFWKYRSSFIFQNNWNFFTKNK